MSDSWKGPSAVIGIMGLLVTIGIFAYQAREARNEKAHQDSIDNKLRFDAQIQKDSITKAAQKAEQKELNKLKIKERILWIDRNLPNYHDSIAIAKNSLQKSTLHGEYSRERLADTIYPPTGIAKEGHVESINDYINDLRDSARIQRLINSLKSERQKLSDSLSLYYQ